MLRRTVTNPYLLRSYKFPKNTNTSIGGVGGSIVWLAPCATNFKQEARAANVLQKSAFMFYDGNKVDPAIFEKDDAWEDGGSRNKTVVVVSAQAVKEDFFQAWRTKLPQAPLTLIRRGTSLGSIDLKAAEKHAVRVINTPGVNSPHVAQYVLETLQLTKQQNNDKVKAVVVGYGSVGKCIVSLMNSVGVCPRVLTCTSMSSPLAMIKTLQADKYELPPTSATLCASVDDALEGATHVALCCPSPANGEPIITTEHIERLLLTAKTSDVRICCIARPDVFSADAILKFVTSSSSSSSSSSESSSSSSPSEQHQLHLNFDYGETVLAPVKKMIEEGTKNSSDVEKARVYQRLAFTTKAMHSEACNQDMDEAVLRVLDPDLPNYITMVREDLLLLQQQQNNTSRNDEQRKETTTTTTTLGVLGGPSAWMQAFLHLSSGSSNKVVLFRPSATAAAIWHSSGRQISLREKVTKFTPLLSGPKNLSVSDTDDKKFLLKSLVTMGATFLYERYSDTPHEEILKQVETSIGNYRLLNSFLQSVNEKPIWIETGRLVIAGRVEQESPLFQQVREWREQKGLLDSPGKVHEVVEYLKTFSSSPASSSSSSSSSAASSSSSSSLLFRSGFDGYPLRCGGFVLRDADTVVLRALQKAFSSERFKIVDSAVKIITALSHQESYRIVCADTSVTDVDALYMSPGATHVVEATSVPITTTAAGDGAAAVAAAATPAPQRMCPPILITGFSGVVRQHISRERRARILDKRGQPSPKSLTDFFATAPCAFMTDDFELTLESVVEDESADGSATIRWRVTGGATINSAECLLNPETALLAPVRRFLDDGGDDAQGITVEDGGWKHCTRICGSQFCESIVPWGPRGVVALNFGHWGVTLAGQDMGLWKKN